MDTHTANTNTTIEEFLAQIRSSDAEARYKAWQSAGPMGAAAIQPLSDLAAGEDKLVALAANGAMEKIAHYAARPGTGNAAEAVSKELLKVADSPRPRMVRTNLLRLVGFIADSRSIPGLVQLLSDPEIREDARLALEKIPGNAATEAFKKAVKTVPADFQPNIRQSLSNRAMTPKTVGTLPAR